MVLESDERPGFELYNKLSAFSFKKVFNHNPEYQEIDGVYDDNEKQLFNIINHVFQDIFEWLDFQKIPHILFTTYYLVDIKSDQLSENKWEFNLTYQLNSYIHLNCLDLASEFKLSFPEKIKDGWK